MSGATVVECSGGASFQDLVKSVLANATATGRFGNAGLTFAPTDSDQVRRCCRSSCNGLSAGCRHKTRKLCSPHPDFTAAVQLLCFPEEHSQVLKPGVCVQGKQGVITQSFAYAMSTLPLTAADLAQAKRSVTAASLLFKCLEPIQCLSANSHSKQDCPD